MYQDICRSLFLAAVCVAASAADHPSTNAFASTSVQQGNPQSANALIATGAGPRSQYDPAQGRALYSSYCESCHQATGEGLPGAFPPLKGSAVVNRDDATKHLQVILQGLRGARVSGVVYTNPMPPFAGILTDAEIAAIVDYERTAWGNHGTLVSATEVAAERLHSAAAH